MAPFTRALLLLFFLLSCSKQSDSSVNASDPSARSNLLLISIDSLRADHVGFYGYQPQFAPQTNITPEMDRLAMKSLVFDEAWSSSSWTLPAHASLFTGLDDLAHGVHNEAFQVDPRQQTLAEHLSAQGYRCLGVYSGPLLKPMWGFGRGFERYESAMISTTELEVEMLKWKEEAQAAGRPEPSPEDLKLVKRHATLWDVSSPRVNKRAMRMLNEVAESSDPFFLFLHYYDAHYDYLPERASPTLASLFDPNYSGRMTGQDWHGNPDVRNTQPPYQRHISRRDLQHVEALYDGEIHWIDFHIGQILAEVRRLNLEQNTVVAIVSDHGDEFFDHGSIGHRVSLFPELTKMVFLIHVPGSSGTAKRSSELTGMMDVAPTLLQALGQEEWPQAMGRSHLSATASSAATLGTTTPEHGLFSHLLVDTPQGLRLIETWRGPQFTVTRPFTIDPSDTTQIRLVQKLFPDQSPAYFVYDREQDSQELKPIPPESPAYKHAIQKMAVAFEEQRKRRATVTRSPFQARLSPMLEGSKDQQELQALGYADASHSFQEQGEHLPLSPLPSPIIPQ